MLASLRSDTWTTSPEQVDGLTGIRNLAGYGLVMVL